MVIAPAEGNASVAVAVAVAMAVFGDGGESERSGDGSRRRMFRSSRDARAEVSFCARADIFPLSEMFFQCDQEVSGFSKSMWTTSCAQTSDRSKKSRGLVVVEITVGGRTILTATAPLHCFFFWHQGLTTPVRRWRQCQEQHSPAPQHLVIGWGANPRPYTSDRTSLPNCSMFACIS